MRRLLRGLGIAVAAIVAIIAVAYAVLYVVSERLIAHAYPFRAVALSVPTDTASIDEGRRLATIRGCFGGCHGKAAGGALMFDQPLIARIVAPNLTDSVRRFSDDELAAIIRGGIRPDGHSMVVMPSEAFGALTDADLGRIVAFLKSLPRTDGPGPSVSIGPLGRAGLAIGKFKLTAELVQMSAPPPEAAGETAGYGRYLARTVCGHCHGTDLGGDSNPEFESPSLHVVAAYSADAFARLMRTGEAIGDRKVGVMSMWARTHLSQLTDAEIAALYEYLHDMPPPARY